jgi:hypothetical protein
MRKKMLERGPSTAFLLTCLFISLNTPMAAGPGNIARLEKVSASAELNGDYSAGNVNDGFIGISGMGEWASDSKENFWGGINYPWIQLDWEESQLIDKIVFYDRAGLTSHLAGGTLQFSNGSELSVNLIPNDGVAGG